MVVPPAVVFAMASIIADAAVAAGQRIGVGEALRDRLLRIAADPAHVCREVLRRVVITPTVAEEHGYLLGRMPLQALEQRGVDGELHQEVALRRPGELRIGDAVAPVAEL